MEYIKINNNKVDPVQRFELISQTNTHSPSESIVTSVPPSQMLLNILSSLLNVWTVV